MMTSWRVFPRTRQQIGENRTAADESPPKLVRDRVTNPVPVPDRDRVVEMVALLDVLDRLLRDVRSRSQVPERVARNRYEREDDHARKDEHDDAVEQSTNDVRQHLATRNVRGTRASLTTAPALRAGAVVDSGD